MGAHGNGKDQEPPISESNASGHCDTGGHTSCIIDPGSQCPALVPGLLPATISTTILNTSLIHGSLHRDHAHHLVLFGQRPNSRIDHLRFVELIIACVVIIGIQIMWLFHHRTQPHTTIGCCLSSIHCITATGVDGKQTWHFRCIHRSSRFGNIHHVGHMLSDSWNITNNSPLLSHNFIDDIILMSSSLIALILGSTFRPLESITSRSKRNLNEAQSLVDASAIGIIQTSCDGTIHYANSYAGRMLNSEEPMVGTRLQNYVKYDHEQQVESMLYAARLSNNVEFELPIKADKTSDLCGLL